MTKYSFAYHARLQQTGHGDFVCALIPALLNILVSTAYTPPMLLSCACMRHCPDHLYPTSGKLTTHTQLLDLMNKRHNSSSCSTRHNHTIMKLVYQSVKTGIQLTAQKLPVCTLLFLISFPGAWNRSRWFLPGLLMIDWSWCP